MGKNPPPNVPTARDDDDDYDYGEYECTRCDGGGFVMACCDDLCRGSGRCVFEPASDGCFVVCQSCKGTGYQA